ncbi:MAG: hypothetical protein A4E58_01715 [Syntrophorhabdus sp. PtaB.Bin006]|nr:MAG: hypothetical protein A4E58_01715 [Syntrophorhabdus sp. PtaB.Bin006]
MNLAILSELLGKIGSFVEPTEKNSPGRLLGYTQKSTQEIDYKILRKVR